MSNYGSPWNSIGGGRRHKSARRQARQRIASNLPIFESLVEQYGYEWRAIATKHCESVLVIDGTDVELTRARLHYWQACGWILLRHVQTNEYVIEVIE